MNRVSEEKGQVIKIMTAKKLAILAMLTAVALIIGTVESMIHLPVPIPGVKLGLANVVTLFMLFSPNTKTDVRFSVADVLAVLLCRILLGALITGRPIALVYSLIGGLLAISAMLVMRRVVTRKQIWACGAVGAVFHNTGQIIAAVIITGTPAIAAYLPMLIIAGIVAGAATGIAAQMLVD